ncbi:Chaperone protein DnaK [compost metagenome]
MIRWVKRRMGENNYHYRIETANDIEFFSPQQISSLILGYVMEYSSKRAPSLKTNNKIVVTVPAFFGDNERQATIDAAKLLNLDVVLIEEPTAAILDYLHDKINSGVISPIDGEKYYAVFDLGGGTFDISVAQLSWNVDIPKIKIIATEGHRKLGGYDFDLDLVEITLEKMISKSPDYEHNLLKMLNALNELRETGVVKDKEVWSVLVRLIDAVEEAKQMLSTINSRKVYMPPHSNMFPPSLYINLKVDDVEKVLEPRLLEIKERVQRALLTSKQNTNGYLDSWDKIESVILVGGSTRIPVVRDLVKKIFGHVPSLDGHEDHTVANGAAIYAGILAGYDIKGNFQRKTVHSYGISQGGRFSLVIPRGTAYPPAKSQIEHPVSFVLSPMTNLKIIQEFNGNNATTEYEEIKEVRYFHPILYTGEILKITMTIDENGLLQIRAEDSTGEQVEEKVQSVAFNLNQAKTQQDQINNWSIKYET